MSTPSLTHARAILPPITPDNDPLLMVFDADYRTVEGAAPMPITSARFLAAIVEGLPLPRITERGPQE